MSLKDEFDLLGAMIDDAEHQAALYHPGPYWAEKSRSAIKEIKKYGISDFRGSTNLIGMSYADNICTDARNSYNQGLRKFANYLAKAFPVSKIFASQVQLTSVHANNSIQLAQEVAKLKIKYCSIFEKYSIPYSLLGGCLTKAEINGSYYSTHYLNLLDQHDKIASRINFSKVHTLFEIGGGFGANVHLLLHNYKNIKKVLYLDIPPNLYVGTQYLKSFYGNAVIDYKTSKNMSLIGFKDDDSLEIYCIAPWQIEQFAGSIDVFINSHSFVEMPEIVVQNYARKFSNFYGSDESAIALTSYDCFNLDSTFQPSLLTSFFSARDFEHFEAETFFNSTSKNLYYVSPGNFSR